MCEILTFSILVEETESDEEADEVGGLFKVAKKAAEENREKKALLNARDCSVFPFETLGTVENDIEEVFFHCV